MKAKAFLDVLTTDKALKINGKVIAKELDLPILDVKEYQDKEIVSIKIHHNCIELEVA